MGYTFAFSRRVWMSWKESSVVDERLRFLARVLDGEPMTEVCRDFGISRKTGYKIFDRYKEHGLEALSDRSRRPVRFANQLPAQLEARIVANLSKLAVWWLRLGIDIERIKPGRHHVTTVPKSNLRFAPTRAGQNSSK
jgi:transposase-like protein